MAFKTLNWVKFVIELLEHKGLALACAVGCWKMIGDCMFNFSQAVSQPQRDIWCRYWWKQRFTGYLLIFIVLNYRTVLEKIQRYEVKGLSLRFSKSCHQLPLWLLWISHHIEHHNFYPPEDRSLNLGLVWALSFSNQDTFISVDMHMLDT